MDMEAKVEQLAKAIYDAGPFGGSVGPWPRALGADTLKGYRAIARAELEREGRLVEALRYANTRLAYLGDVVATPVVSRALCAYEAEFAPPEPLWRVDHHSNGHHYIWRGDQQLGALWHSNEGAAADAMVDAMNAAALKRQGGA